MTTEVIRMIQRVIAENKDDEMNGILEKLLS
jgi:hypothetical protein